MSSTWVFANNVTTVASGSSGTTAPAQGTSETWTVTSSAGFPAIGTAGLTQFTVVDVAATSEIILVTQVSGTTWTVTRGAESTTPVAHGTGATYQAIITAAGLNAMVQGPLWYSATAAGIQANTVADQSAAINAWLLSLPAGATAFFPAAGTPPAQTRYYVNRAVEVPRTVRIAGGAWGIATPIFTAMSGFGDKQIMRNWQYADFAGSPVFNAPDKTAWGTSGTGNNYVHLENIAFDVNGNSSITALSLVHLQERTFIQNLTFTNSQGATGSGNVALALFANSDAPGTISGRFVINSLTGYGLGWQNWIYADGTNGYTSSLTVANRINDLEITSFTTPANATAGGGNQANGGTACSDSPLFFRYIGRVHIVGHCEIPPSNATADTAMIRVINCTDVLVENFYTLTGTGAYRPFLKATQDPNASSVYPSITGSQVGPCLQNVTFSGGGGWAERTDASCGITAASNVVTDASVAATDLYRPVYGPGIPSGAYISSVTAGVSFTMSVTVNGVTSAANALITGTVSLVISSNVIEDETAAGGTAPGTGVIRHFRWNATYFSPHNIIDYHGTEITWTQYQSNATAVIKRARSVLSSEAALAQMAPAGAVAESFPRGWASPVTGTAILTSQTLTLVAVPVYPGDKVSSLAAWSGSTAMSGPVNWWFAFFDQSLNQVAVSADQLTAGWAANAKKTLAMTAAWSASLPALHYAGILVNAATPPSVEAAVQENTGSASPVLNGTSTAALTTPATCPATAAALAYVAGRPYVLVT